MTMLLLSSPEPLCAVSCKRRTLNCVCVCVCAHICVMMRVLWAYSNDPKEVYKCGLETTLRAKASDEKPVSAFFINALKGTLLRNAK